MKGVSVERRLLFPVKFACIHCVLPISPETFAYLEASLEFEMDKARCLFRPGKQAETMAGFYVPEKHAGPFPGTILDAGKLPL